ncbi:hypothetical protein ACFY9Q_00825 [Streptomyces sp. NPDC012389]|uniref:hypothetical protein n=1 Tax=Streptomyces sp. NPDC012389 TaxID=3364830 RepID=UPI0036EA39BB
MEWYLGVLAGTFVPIIYQAIKQLLQLRRLNSVHVDIDRHTATIMPAGRDANPVDIDLTDKEEAARLNRYLDRYDRRAGREA